MLDVGKIVQALETRRDAFTDFDRDARDEHRRYGETLTALVDRTRDEVDAAITEIPFPGARVTGEHDDVDGPTVPFSETWANHQEARRWAREVVEGVSTFAVDGSQIPPQKEFSVPVALVQAGWFENPHDGSRPYEKDVRVEVLTPDELFDDDDGQATGFPDWRVNLKRFRLEIDTLIDYIDVHAGDAVKPVCFFDGSLVVSFVQHMLPERQRQYIDQVCRLLAASEQHRVPLVGYVDTSYANDVTTLLAHLEGWSPTHRVSDAALFRSHLAWGDRSHVYVCARNDNVLKFYRDPDNGRRYSDRICFVYLQTTSDAVPARLDFPRWMYETGEIERTLDIVRAECVVGNGYPYAVETADAVAVLTMRERERFYRVFQEFLEQEGVPLRFSRKALSKRRRR